MRYFDETPPNYAALKKRYYALAKKHHPDYGGDAARMQEINAQYAEALERLSRKLSDDDNSPISPPAPSPPPTQNKPRKKRTQKKRAPASSQKKPERNALSDDDAEPPPLSFLSPRFVDIALDVLDAGVRIARKYRRG